VKKIIFLAALCAFSAVIFSFFSCGSKNDSQKDAGDAAQTSEMRIVQDAKDLYIYGFPLVLMHIGEKVMTNVKNPPLNRFENSSGAAAGAAGAVGSDIFRLYSWIELGREPLVFELPNMRGRYALFEIFDAWNNLITSAGSRSAGTKKQRYLLTAPGWSGTVPDGTVQIKVPTEMAFISGILHVSDYDDKTELENRFRLVALSRIDDESYALPDVKVDETMDMSEPVLQVFKMDITGYFNLLGALMSENPPAAADSEFLEKMRYLKIYPDAEFDLSVFDERTQSEFKNIPQWAKERLTELSAKKDLSGGWSYFQDKRVYGADYLGRAVSAFKAIGATSSDNAVSASCVSDADGNALNGANKYTVHLDKDSFPQGTVFWNFSVYDSAGKPLETPYGRKTGISDTSISDDTGAKINKDGSVDIYIQSKKPAKEKISNWLFVPDSSDFIAVITFYLGEGAVAQKNLKLSPVVKISSDSATDVK